MLLGLYEALACDVRFTPESGHCRVTARCPLCAKSGHSAMRQKLALFDHLVGGNEQLVRDAEAKHPGALVIDDQLELGRL
jgi:hypothetical protein